MADFPFDIVGFDLDGTLFDTSGDLAAALNHVLTGLGRAPLSREAVTPMVGRGSRFMLQQGLEATGGYDPTALDGHNRDFLAFYAANIARETRPFPGLLAALDELAARGVAIGIVTNKFEALAVKLVAKLGLSDRFACVIGGDTMGKGNAKPSPLPIREMIARCGGGSAAFVGDSIYDVGAARNAGIPSVAVAFGYLWQPVAELGADAVIEAYAELVPTLERLAAH